MRRGVKDITRTIRPSLRSANPNREPVRSAACEAALRSGIPCWRFLRIIGPEQRGWNFSPKRYNKIFLARMGVGRICAEEENHRKYSNVLKNSNITHRDCRGRHLPHRRIKTDGLNCGRLRRAKDDLPPDTQHCYIARETFSSAKHHRAPAAFHHLKDWCRDGADE